jgi:glycosyltransferase involved in cell wall biosynthesis
MFFTVVMQSNLSDFPGAASKRKEKLIRAINSVLHQQCKCQFELIVIADRCPDTFNIVQTEFADYFETGKNIRLFLLPGETEIRTNRWNSSARNVGIDKASGKWVLYLDNDDYFANDYLRLLCNSIRALQHGRDWLIVDDMTYNGKQFVKRRCNLDYGNCGTSNIVHRKTMKSRWPLVSQYARDDWQFINNLTLESKNNQHLEIAGYCCCHIPGKTDI